MQQQPFFSHLSRGNDVMKGDGCMDAALFNSSDGCSPVHIYRIRSVVPFALVIRALHHCFSAVGPHLVVFGTPDTTTTTTAATTELRWQQRQRSEWERERKWLCFHHLTFLAPPLPPLSLIESLHTTTTNRVSLYSIAITSLQPHTHT